MDQALNELRRAAQAEPENLELWRRLFQAEQNRGWNHKGLDADQWWSRLAREYDRAPIIEELADAGALAAVLLIERLRDPAWRAKVLAAECLALLGPRAPFVAPELRRGLDHHMREVRDAIIDALETIAPGAPETLDIVLAACHDEAGWVRGWAASALARLGASAPTVEALIARLADPEPSVRMRAAEAAERLRDPTLTPALRPLLTEDYPDLRRQAVDALAPLAREHQEARSAIAPMLDDRDPEVREAAVRALESADAQDEAAAILLPIARDPNHDRYRWAALILARLAPDRPETIPLLRSHIADPIWRFRLNVTEALARLAADPHTGRQTRVDDDGALLDVRIEEGGRPRPTPTQSRIQDLIETIPDLLTRLEDKEREIRDAAVDALASIPGGPEAARPALLARSREDRAERRAWAITALARLAGEDAASIARVGALLQDPEWTVRLAAAYACRHLHDASAFLDPLQACLQESYWQLRINVLQCLPRIALNAQDPARQRAIALLVEGIADRTIEVRDHAIGGLIEAAQHLPEAFEALRAFLEATHDRRYHVLERIYWSHFHGEQREALLPIARDFLADESAPPRARIWLTRLLASEHQLSDDDRALLTRYRDHDNRSLRSAIQECLEAFERREGP